ncbi:MAG: hypothetical protein GY856_02375 [bacterium]|nr:hypothetical protein [bacterium]
MVIPESLIEIPLDLFHFEDRPLFLQKPVAYSFSRQGRREFPFLNDWSALIISDRTADPENGTYYLKKLLPSSDYHNIRDLDLKRLQALPAVDVLLVSGHGMILPDGEDFIVLNRRLN